MEVTAEAALFSTDSEVKPRRQRTFVKKEKLYSYLESWQICCTYNDDNQMTAAKKREGNLLMVSIYDGQVQPVDFCSFLSGTGKKSK